MSARSISQATPTDHTRHLRFINVLYFFIWGAIGLYAPFVNLYYLDFGLTGTQIGTINAIAPLMGAAGSTLAGILSDRTGQTRLLFAGAAGGLIVAVIALSQATSFLTILLCAAAVTFFLIPCLTLLDSTTLKLLGDRAGEYGRYRLWGTIGFIATNAAAGYLIEATGIRVIFTSFPIGIALFLIVSHFLPNQVLFTNASPFRGIRAMVRQPAWTWFAVSVFTLWLASTGGLGFLNLTIKRLDGGESLVGLAFTFAAIAEIPFFLFSARILRKFGSAKLLTLAFSSYAVRFLLYSWVRNPAFIPVIGLMQSISFTPFQIASIHYANEQAPANLKATSQGLLTAVMNFASMAGAFTGGRLLDAAGPSGLYRSMAAVSLLALVVFLTSRWKLRRQVLAR